MIRRHVWSVALRATLIGAALLLAFPPLAAEEESAALVLANGLSETVRYRLEEPLRGESTELLEPGVEQVFHFPAEADCADRAANLRIQSDDGALLATARVVVRGVLDTVGLARWCHMRIQQPETTVRDMRFRLRWKSESWSRGTLTVSSK